MGAGCLRPGYVYALWSDNSPFIKVGRTTTTPFQRLNEINNASPYREHGPWHLLDCKNVVNCFELETALHRKLSALRTADVPSANELFQITRADALALLASIPTSDLWEAVPVAKLELEPEFNAYISRLFELTGIEAFLDQQEAWTFSLFPSTSGGRYFTMNIGRHEVAYSALPFEQEDYYPPLHVLVVDALINREKDVKGWLKERNGRIDKTPYKSARPNAVAISFEGEFEEVLGLFEIPGFRRALIAYWYDALLEMRRKGTRSLFAKHHNYSAISSIVNHMREVRSFRSTSALPPS